MSNVIPFKRRPEPQPEPSPNLQDAAAALASTDAIISAILLEGIDNLPKALEKATSIVNAMPRGGARDLAERELGRLLAGLKSG